MFRFGVTLLFARAYGPSRAESKHLKHLPCFRCTFCELSKNGRDTRNTLIAITRIAAERRAASVRTLADTSGTRLDLQRQLANPFGQILTERERAQRDMGGFGSGGHNKRRPHLEGYQRISVRTLRRHRLLQAGVYATLSWQDNWKRPTGSVQVVGGSEGVTLIYSARADEAGEWTQVEERVTFARVARHFGGEQTYFRCPRCNRRTTELALGQQRFRCRTCLGLVHASSQEGPTDRAMRKANKLKRRLGAEAGLDSFYWRPKHMRQRTFDRIDTRIRHAEAEVNDAHILLLARLGSTSRRRSCRRAGVRSPASVGRFW